MNKTLELRGLMQEDTIWVEGSTAGGVTQMLVQNHHISITDPSTLVVYMPGDIVAVIVRILDCSDEHFEYNFPLMESIPTIYSVTRDSSLDPTLDPEIAKLAKMLECKLP